MKFNELTIRELKAQATSACIKAVRLLEKSQLSKFDFLTVDFITPMKWLNFFIPSMVSQKCGM